MSNRENEHERGGPSSGSDSQGASFDTELVGEEGGAIAKRKCCSLDFIDQVQVGPDSRRNETYHKGVGKVMRLDVPATDAAPVDTLALIAHTEDDCELASQLKGQLLEQNVCGEVVCSTAEASTYLEVANRCDLLLVVLSNTFVWSHQQRMVYMLLQDVLENVCKVFTITTDKEVSEYWMPGFPPPLGRVHCNGDTTQSMETLMEVLRGWHNTRQNNDRCQNVDMRETVQVHGDGSSQLPVTVSNSKYVQAGAGNTMEIHYHGDTYLLQLDPGPIIKVLNVGDRVEIEGELGHKKFTFKLKVSAADQETCGAVEEQMMKDLTLEESPTLPQLDHLFRSESLRILKVGNGCIEFVLVTEDATAVVRFQEKLLSGDLFKDFAEILVTENVKRISKGEDWGLTIRVVSNEENEEVEQDESKTIANCFQHHSQKVTSFCDDCKQLACNECLTEHERHDILDLKMAAKQADDRTRQIVEAVKSQQRVGGVALSLAQRVLGHETTIEKLQEYVKYTSVSDKLSRDASGQGRRLKKLLPRPKLLETFDTHVTRGYPSCMVFTNDKHIVVDSDNEKVNVFGRDGTFLHELKDGQYKLSCPQNVACNDDGDVFVVDVVEEHCNIAVYGQDLKQKTVIKEPLSSVEEDVDYDVLACDNNRLVMKVSGKLVVMNMDGEIQQVIDKGILGLYKFNPWGVTFSPSGNIITTSHDTRCVYILDRTGTRLLHTYKTEGDIVLKYPVGVCCDEWGRIIIADDVGKSLHVISTTGEHLGILEMDPDKMPRVVKISGPGEVSVLYRCGTANVYKYLA